MERDAVRPLEGLRILLVEDEDDVREVMGILLRLGGAKVSEAATVEEALASYENERPDCLVADLNIDHDGCALLENIRALGAPGESLVPAIALTGHVLTEDRERAFAAGFRAYLTKPVDPSELVRVIVEVARGAASS
jgi:CheY-like chemotaxis protein